MLSPKVGTVYVLALMAFRPVMACMVNQRADL
jgi:hypothetical protein